MLTISANPHATLLSRGATQTLWIPDSFLLRLPGRLVENHRPPKRAY